MNARRGEWIWVVGIAAVFAVVSLWIILNNAPKEQAGPAYSTNTYDPRGDRALYELLEKSGYAVEQYGGSEYELPPDGCVAMVSDSSSEMTSLASMMLDQKALKLWIEEGGTLVLITDPRSFMAMEFLGIDDFSVNYQQAVPAGGFDEIPPPQQLLEQTAAGRDGSGSAFSREYRPGQVYSLKTPRSLLWEEVETLEIAEPENVYHQVGTELVSVAPPAGQPLLIYEERGEGRVFWLTTPEITTNLWIDRADNHRLLLTLFTLAADGRPVHFFEKIHGFTRQRHNVGSLIVQTRGGRLLLALGLCMVLSFAPLAVRPSRSERQPVEPRRYTAEMIFAQADLFRRARKYRSAANAAVGRLVNQLVESGHIPQLPHEADRRRQVLEWMSSRRINSRMLERVLKGHQVANGRQLATLARECAAMLIAAQGAPDPADKD